MNEAHTQTRQLRVAGGRRGGDWPWSRETITVVVVIAAAALKEVIEHSAKSAFKKPHETPGKIV